MNKHHQFTKTKLLIVIITKILEDQVSR